MLLLRHEPTSAPPPARAFPVRGVVLCALVVGLLGCQRSDVGQPCNHGTIDAPQNPVVTFPSLACDHLLCVYGEDLEVPGEPCASDEECNATDPGQRRFECTDGACRILDDYVLSRSMCSQFCESDGDCQGGADDTECRTGFACARIQRLDEFCCQKMCVCQDDLGTQTDLDDQCEAGTLEGCCNQTPKPDACGPF